MNPSRLRDEARAFGIDLSSEQLSAFEAFEGRIYATNEVKNLTRVPREECWSRHFLDSLAPSRFIPNGSTVLDIGTGAGFPGVPLAIARPDLKVSLMEAAQKEVDFLRSLPFDISVLRGRAEDLGRVHREQFDVVTGRALAPLPAQLEVSAPFAKVGGLIIPMRTEKDKSVAQKSFAVLGIELVAEHSPLYLPIYEKKSPTPQEFPRSWALIRNRPLA